MSPDGSRVVWTAVLADIAGQPIGPGDTVELDLNAAVAAAGIDLGSVTMSGPDGDRRWEIVGCSGEHEAIVGMNTRGAKVTLAVSLEEDPEPTNASLAIRLTRFEPDESGRIHQHHGRVAALTPEAVMEVWCRSIMGTTLAQLPEFCIQGDYGGTPVGWLASCVRSARGRS